ncbi:hypothetical protein ACIA5C_09620 [Actinoplanes sp. NPDC051343]|uniref:hypothetical protein n=1 Tax=Actinoplanes sp. NPDC051343 TaxID=3363906 RepID=UPI00378D841C
MGGTADALTDVAVPRGLIRVRVHARDRLHETVRTDGDPPERHEFHIWAVPEETPWRTVVGSHPAWEQKPARAAEWAMLSLVRRPAPPTPDDARVTVVRHRSAAVEAPVGVLPAGDLEVRLERADDETLRWSRAAADEPIFPHPLTTLPDSEPSTVRLASAADGWTLRHEGVLGRQAAAVGLIWDHLLDNPGSHPWTATLQAQAARNEAA